MTPDKKEIVNQSDDTTEVSGWASDQKERQYYYDDACGYEVFTEDEGEEDNDDF